MVRKRQHYSHLFHGKQTIISIQPSFISDAFSFSLFHKQLLTLVFLSPFLFVFLFPFILHNTLNSHHSLLVTCQLSIQQSLATTTNTVSCCPLRILHNSLSLSLTYSLSLKRNLFLPPNANTLNSNITLFAICSFVYEIL